MSRVGVIALARPTFDVEFAEEIAETAFEALERAAPGFVGSRQLLFDSESTATAISALRAEPLDALVVLQVTFTDASMTEALAAAVNVPLILWAFPEDRTGGRLRLNSLCGINLAGYTLRREGRRFGYMYRRADDPAAVDELAQLIAGDEATRIERPDPAEPGPDAAAVATRVAAALSGRTTGVIGPHPDGFDPCAYEADEVRRLTGVSVDRIELPDLFAAADAASEDSLASARKRATTSLGSLDDLDQTALDQSLRIYCGLSWLAKARHWSALATRCWPECFTEYGGAACAPQAMITNEGIPGGCEADVFGNLTSLILQEMAEEPPFVADLVDLDFDDDTAVFWHCGVAPLHMADPVAKPSPTVHSNRRKPLLHEFPLKPGRVTIARLSQAGGSPKLVIGAGTMLRAPLPFAGTAGVARLDRPATEVLTTVMDEGLEHHYGIVYGDHRAALQALAAEWEIPTVWLT